VPAIPLGAAEGARPAAAFAGKTRRIDRFGATAYIAAMALRDILILPDKRLRKVSEPVKKVDAGVRKLVEDMFETMYDAPGIGLAAIQIGTPKRVVTLDLAKKEEAKNPQVFINPEIVWASDEKALYEEGCLSIPEYYGDVERPAQVKVKYLDLDGKPHEIEANGLLATCLQHEIDHLNGVLFIDHLSKLKRDRVLKKFTKAAKRTSEPKRAAE
jgi:peptide deformylase